MGTVRVLASAAAARVGWVILMSSTLCYGARYDNPALMREQQPVRLRVVVPAHNRDLVEIERYAKTYLRDHPRGAAVPAALRQRRRPHGQDTHG